MRKTTFTNHCHGQVSRSVLPNRLWARLGLILGLTAMTAANMSAGTLLVGSNASAPDQVQRTDDAAALLALIGPHNASAAVRNSIGHTFFAIPGDTSSTVEEYDGAQNLI